MEPTLTELLAIVGAVTGTVALVISVLRGRISSSVGNESYSRFVCQTVKADYDNDLATAQQRYGFDTYCEWFNHPEYSSITQYCERGNC